MNDETGNWGPSTRAVHSGRGYDAGTGAVMPPVFLTSTFENGNPGGFDYTRSGNPNFRLLDETVGAGSALEIGHRQILQNAEVINLKF